MKPERFLNFVREEVYIPNSSMRSIPFSYSFDKSLILQSHDNRTEDQKILIDSVKKSSDHYTYYNGAITLSLTCESLNKSVSWNIYPQTILKSMTDDPSKNGTDLLDEFNKYLSTKNNLHGFSEKYRDTILTTYKSMKESSSTLKYPYFQTKLLIEIQIFKDSTSSSNTNLPQSSANSKQKNGLIDVKIQDQLTKIMARVHSIDLQSHKALKLAEKLLDHHSLVSEGDSLPATKESHPLDHKSKNIPGVGIVARHFLDFSKIVMDELCRDIAMQLKAQNLVLEKFNNGKETPIFMILFDLFLGTLPVNDEKGKFKFTETSEVKEIIREGLRDPSNPNNRLVKHEFSLGSTDSYLPNKFCIIYHNMILLVQAGIKLEQSKKNKDVQLRSRENLEKVKKPDSGSEEGIEKKKEKKKKKVGKNKKKKGNDSDSGSDDDSDSGSDDDSDSGSKKKKKKEEKEGDFLKMLTSTKSIIIIVGVLFFILFMLVFALIIKGR